jgi:hypothetical protein
MRAARLWFVVALALGALAMGYVGLRHPPGGLGQVACFFVALTKGAASLLTFRQEIG